MNNQYEVLVFKLILACTVAMLFDRSIEEALRKSIPVRLLMETKLDAIPKNDSSEDLFTWGHQTIGVE